MSHCRLDVGGRFESARRDPAGWTLTLWNGITDDDAVAPLRISWGSAVDDVGDDIVFQLPRPVAAAGLYRIESMLRLFDVMISAWQPQWCRVRAGEFGYLAGRESLDALDSWIVYLEGSVHTRTGSLSGDVKVIEGTDGDLCVLAPAPDELRPETVERLRAAVTLKR